MSFQDLEREGGDGAGFDGVLINTAVSRATAPVRMARALTGAVKAELSGKQACGSAIRWGR